MREAGDFFDALAGSGRTVIVLEDLHYGDLETVELLRALAKRHPPRGLLVLGTYTPSAATATVAALRVLASELHFSGRTMPIRLQPLKEEHVRAYLAQRFGAGPIEALARMVRELGGGNPLVMVTTMDALVSEGEIGLHEGCWRLHHVPTMLEARQIYRSHHPAHAELLKGRRNWFEQFAGAYAALWWVPAGHVPGIDEAKKRLAHLEEHGPSQFAFTFKQVFPADEEFLAAFDWSVFRPCAV